MKKITKMTYNKGHLKDPKSYVLMSSILGIITPFILVFLFPNFMKRDLLDILMPLIVLAFWIFLSSYSIEREISILVCIMTYLFFTAFVVGIIFLYLSFPLELPIELISPFFFLFILSQVDEGWYFVPKVKKIKIIKNLTLSLEPIEWEYISVFIFTLLITGVWIKWNDLIVFLLSSV